MQETRAGRHWLRTLLIASLAFNVGFGTTFAVRAARRSGEAVVGVRTPGPADTLPLTPATESQKRLLAQIEEFRGTMAEEQASLADLLVAPDPDRVAIAKRLEAMAVLQRKTQACVIDYLLEEKRRIPPDGQKAFNEDIRKRVCPNCRHKAGGGRGGQAGCGRHEGGRGQGRGRGQGKGAGRGACNRNGAEETKP
jgi:Spy/CpxP family protein refolding chaperone